jgi:hypothetical protein
LRSVEPALHITQLDEELERILPANGVPGAGAEPGDRAAELLDLEAAVHPSGLTEQVFVGKRSPLSTRRPDRQVVEGDDGAKSCINTHTTASTVRVPPWYRRRSC